MRSFSKLSLLTLLIAISAGSLRAIEPMEGFSKGSSREIQIIISQKGTRPKDPNPPFTNPQYIYCTYCQGNLYFDFLMSEGSCDLTVLHDTGISTYRFDTGSPQTIYIGSTSHAVLDLSTGTGNEYTGQF